MSRLGFLHPALYPLVRHPPLSQGFADVRRATSKEVGGPMKQKQIGFRDLLERLLPVDELPPVDRMRVQRALRSGVGLEMDRAAMLCARV